MLNHSNSNIPLIQLAWCRIAPTAADGLRGIFIIYDFII